MANPIFYAIAIGVAVGAAIFAIFNSGETPQSYEDTDRRRKREFDWTDFDDGSGEGRQCTICLDPIPANQIKYLNCCHAFHERCINNWLKQSKICPNCRSNI